MKKFIQRSWIFILVWAAAAALAVWTMPDMGALVRERGQVEIGKEYSYSIGKDILKEMDGAPAGSKEIETAMIYRNSNGLTDADKLNIKVRLDLLEQYQSDYHVIGIKNALTNTDLQDLLISDDGTTLLVPVTFDDAGRSTDEIRDVLTATMPVDGVEFYTTGADFVTEDFIKTTEAGIERTELITIIFIVLVLLVIFLSPVTPLVVLATVALAFFVSLNVVLQLVGWVNFPISNFTKVFLILILFGIGTDYSLLLLMRYREELANGVDKVQAILNSYRTAGKTVFFSSLTILIGFTSLYFVRFGTYRSGAGVAIGVAVLLLILFSFVPAMMYIFGKNLFWSPFKSKGHTESRGWRKVSGFAVKFPGLAFLATLLICGLIYFNNTSLSFNNLKEVNPEYPSIVGNNVATKEFSVGLTLPVTIAIDSPIRMDTPEALADLDKLTEILRSIDGVKTVHSVTQPKGERLEQLYLNDQSETLDDGLTDAQDGLTEIHDGLQEAIDKIEDADYKEDSIQDLKDGADDLVSALGEVSDGDEDLLDGTKQALSGSQDLADGLATVDDSLATFQTSLTKLQTLYGQVAAGYTQIDTNLISLKTSVSGIKSGLEGVMTMQSGLALYPYDVNHDGAIDATETLAGDTLFQQMAGTTSALDTGLGKVSDGLTSIETGLAGANTSLAQINAGLAKAQDGLTQIKGGTAELRSGSTELEEGLEDLKSGQKQVVSAMASVEDGARQLRDGQNKLIDGIDEIQGKMGELSDGLGDANDGVDEISNGLVDATDYLQGLNGSAVSTSTFYIPEDEIYGDEFPRSMNIFFSEDKQITQMIIVLDVDPYSLEGMRVVRNINSVFAAALQTTSLHDAKWGTSGITQMNLDLQSMSNADFALARVIMLAGIFVVMLFITRDFWMTLFVSMSLVASYFIALTLSGLAFHKVLAVPQLSWNVPFFSFIMIVTLGVDYSIFLIMRQKENCDMPATESVVEAAARVGSVIVSAGLILSGTFAAMLPSGVLTLMEVAVTVIIGILLLCLVFIPIFIPCMISFQHKLTGLQTGESKPSLRFRPRHSN